MRCVKIGLAFILLSTISTGVLALEKPKNISIKGRDGQMLSALYTKPTKGQPVIILLHGLSSTKEEWNAFSKSLAQAGWGVLAYDARAHGKSDFRKLGVKSLGNPGPDSQWEKMIDDLGSVVRYVEKKGIDRSSIAVCGASMGANVAAHYAAITSPLQSLVLLSPGMDYVGFKPEKDIVKIPSRTLIIASQSDTYAYESSLRFKNLAPAHDLWTDVPPGHGVQMLTPEFSQRLIQWLKHQNN